MKNAFFLACILCVVNISYAQERPNITGDPDSSLVKKERAFDPEAKLRSKKEKPALPSIKLSLIQGIPPIWIPP